MPFALEDLDSNLKMRSMLALRFDVLLVFKKQFGMVYYLCEHIR